MLDAAIRLDTPANPAAAPERRNVLVHLTPFAPGIPLTAKMSDPCRWMRLGGPSPLQAIQRIAERLQVAPPLLRMTANRQGEVEIGSRWLQGETLAVVVEGLTLEEAQAAAAALGRCRTQ